MAGRVDVLPAKQPFGAVQGMTLYPADERVSLRRSAVLFGRVVPCYVVLGEVMSCIER